ncbi:MAG: lipopolysaccharide biosynthesis protein [Cyclobacteriaceae bacterium]
MSPHKKVAKNIASLGLLQITNYLVPVIAIPILLNRIGLENYGVIALAQGIMNVIVSFTDYGLNLTGTRLISQNAENKVEQGRIGFMIIMIKVILIVAFFIILWVLVQFVPIWTKHAWLILSSYLIVIGNSLMPVWYFQGIQKMSRLALFNFISRSLYIIGILIFIQDESSFIYVNVINGLCWIIAAAIALLAALNRIDFKVRFTSATEAFVFAKNNTSVFLSIVSGTAYRNTSIILAGFFLNSYWLGVYGVLDKIIMLIINSFSLVFRAIFPTLCTLIREEAGNLKKFILLTFGRLTLLLVPGVIILYWIGGDVIALLSDQITTEEIVPYMGLVALIPVVLFINLPVSLLMISHNMKREYLVYNSSALIVVLLISPILATQFQIYGLIGGIALAECAMLVVGILIILIKGLKLNEQDV